MHRRASQSSHLSFENSLANRVPGSSAAVEEEEGAARVRGARAAVQSSQELHKSKNESIASPESPAPVCIGPGSSARPKPRPDAQSCSVLARRAMWISTRQAGRGTHTSCEPIPLWTQAAWQNAELVPNQTSQAPTNTCQLVTLNKAHGRKFTTRTHACAPITWCVFCFLFATPQQQYKRRPRPTPANK